MDQPVFKGSHNSMTYLTPTKWYTRLFNWMAKCQDLTIDEQIKSGIKFLDLRIRFKNNKPIFAHGFVEYDCDVFKILELINELNKDYNFDAIITLECNNYNEHQFDLFNKFIKELNYDWIATCYVKWDWSIIKCNRLIDVQYHYSSMPGNNIIWSLYPRLWKELNPEPITSKILFTDFV